MASTSLVTAVCERIIEKLRKENPGVEYRHKPKEVKCKENTNAISRRKKPSNAKKTKKLRVLN